MSIAKIANVEVIPVNYKSTNWDQSTVLIRLTDENGVTGIGECDGPTSAIKAFIEMETAHCWSQNITNLLIGADPMEITALWDKMYDATVWPGRRGLGIHALSGIDVALYDLVGKQLGVPAYKLMGGAQRDKLTPYATLYPTLPDDCTLVELLKGYEELMHKAKKLGFKAVKMSIMMGAEVTDLQLVEFIKEARKALGFDTELMIDFLYRWRDWYDVKWVLNRIADCDLYFAEAVLQHDNLEGHARLSENSPVRICGAEMATTRWEVKEWIEKGKVAVVQPDINRCGGLTEIRRIADMCELYGVQVIPHGWKTGITAATGRHFHAATKDATYFEYLHPDLYDSPLRRGLVTPEPEVINGFIALPTEPGLGIELNTAML